MAGITVQLSTAQWNALMQQLETLSGIPKQLTSLSQTGTEILASLTGISQQLGTLIKTDTQILEILSVPTENIGVKYGAPEPSNGSPKQGEK